MNNLKTYSASGCLITFSSFSIYLYINNMRNTCCQEVDPQETGFELEVSSQAQLYLLPSWKTGSFIVLFEFRNAKATKHTIYMYVKVNVLMTILVFYVNVLNCTVSYIIFLMNILDFSCWILFSLFFYFIVVQ